MSVKFNNSVMILTFILFFFILCKSTLQCRKTSNSETFEKFQCERQKTYMKFTITNYNTISL